MKTKDPHVFGGILLPMLIALPTCRSQLGTPITSLQPTFFTQMPPISSYMTMSPMTSILMTSSTSPPHSTVSTFATPPSQLVSSTTTIMSSDSVMISPSTDSGQSPTPTPVLETSAEQTPETGAVSGDDTNDALILAGQIAGGIVGLLLIVVIIVVVWRRRRNVNTFEPKLTRTESNGTTDSTSPMMASSYNQTSDHVYKPVVGVSYPDPLRCDYSEHEKVEAVEYSDKPMYTQVNKSKKTKSREKAVIFNNPVYAQVVKGV